ncbi:MAG TPA: hypothetical protein VN044_00955, partial [Verrucomicrobiae bacterium]|nr:hypothetical protein [Verrucomicrobiae bacterium]
LEAREPCQNMDKATVGACGIGPIDVIGSGDQSLASRYLRAAAEENVAAYRIPRGREGPD